MRGVFIMIAHKGSTDYMLETLMSGAEFEAEDVEARKWEMRECEA